MTNVILQAPYLVYVEVLECDNAHQAPVPAKILDNTIRLTRSDDDLTRYTTSVASSANNGSPQIIEPQPPAVPSDEFNDECIWSLEEDEIIAVGCLLALHSQTLAF